MATTVTLKPNAIDLSGSTSGTTTLQASAVAGTTTVTLPAATDTLVGKATTDTLTNKTLTSPTMTAPVLGTPASGTVTNLTGTASININGTVGATTPAAGSFTTLSATGDITASGAGAKTVKIASTDGTSAAIELIRTGGGGDFRIKNAAGLLTINYGTDDTSFATSCATIEATNFGLPALLDLSAATAGQIKFPATQNASADANTLDDYEEGTWTPSLSFGGESTGITYANQNGLYTKVGRLSCVSGYLTLTSKGSLTGAGALLGLPFTVINNAGGYSPAGIKYANIASTGQLTAMAIINSTQVNFDNVTAAGVLTQVQYTAFANDSQVFVSTYYFV